ncbi:MAG: VOC family protein [Lentimicrobium sp.]|nr:VOC family protein [Lentimicrobium sp.]
MEILNHLAIPLRFADDIKCFYADILGFSEKYRFEIDRDTAVQIFGISEEITVSVIERDGFSIELFHLTDLFQSGIMHICLNVPDISEVCRQAEASGYPVVMIPRPSAAIAFITDKTGNRFEIKEKR